MKIWTYIETHHEDFGVALFILPPCAIAVALAALACALANFIG
jgi:hypothetical protein